MSAKKDKNETRSLNLNLDEDNETTTANQDQRDASDRYRGFFGRWRLTRDRSRTRVKKWWSYYLENVVPTEDDDAPESLPRIFHGRVGRLLLAGCAVIAMGVWVLLLVLLWTL